MSDVDARPGYALQVDLEKQQVTSADGLEVMDFDVDAFRKHCLLEGLDDIGLTLRHEADIRQFEASRRQQAPWLFVESGS